MKKWPHIRKARRLWTCKHCHGEIYPGETHFVRLGPTLPYGRYVTSMPEFRTHLWCTRPEDTTCCSSAPDELAAALLQREVKQNAAKRPARTPMETSL